MKVQLGWARFSIPHRSLTNFEAQKYYHNEPNNGVYSKNDLPKIKDEAYVINLDRYESIGTQQIVLNVINNNVTYFNSFGVKHIPKEIEKCIGNENIKTTTYRIQAYSSIMCGYFCNGFIVFMLKGQSSLDYTNLFSLNEYENNDEILPEYFQ